MSFLLSLDPNKNFVLPLNLKAPWTPSGCLRTGLQEAVSSLQQAPLLTAFLTLWDEGHPLETAFVLSKASI